MAAADYHHSHGQVALMLHGINDLRIEKHDSHLVPQPSKKDLGPHDVLVAPQSVGICGTDVHFVTHGEIGALKVEAPMIPGHETSGLVMAVGSEVTNLKEGDRVAVEVGISCRRCNQCKEGRYNLCPKQDFGSLPPCHGSLRPLGIWPDDFCFKIPPQMSYDEAAAVEPLAVGVAAIKRAQITVGDTLLITGAGPIGLMCLFVGSAAGATTVILTDIAQERLDLAKKLGATMVINTREENLAQVLADKEIIVDISIDCTGHEKAIADCLNNTKPAGRVVMVGLGAADMNLPITNAQLKEIDVVTVFKYSQCYQRAINLIASGKVNVQPIITHHYDLSDAVEAFETAKNGRDKSGKMSVKTMLHVGNAGKWQQQQRR